MDDWMKDKLDAFGSAEPEWTPGNMAEEVVVGMLGSTAAERIAPSVFPGLAPVMAHEEISEALRFDLPDGRIEMMAESKPVFSAETALPLRDLDHSPPCYLLDKLPSEMRNEIWSLVALRPDGLKLALTPPHIETQNIDGLASACKQIRQECLEVILNTNTISCSVESESFQSVREPRATKTRIRAAITRTLCHFTISRITKLSKIHLDLYLVPAYVFYRKPENPKTSTSSTDRKWKDGPWLDPWLAKSNIVAQLRQYVTHISVSFGMYLPDPRYPHHTGSGYRFLLRFRLDFAVTDTTTAWAEVEKCIGDQLEVDGFDDGEKSLEGMREWVYGVCGRGVILDMSSDKGWCVVGANTNPCDLLPPNSDRDKKDGRATSLPEVCRDVHDLEIDRRYSFSDYLQYR